MHGLHSHVHPDKRKILEKHFGEVIAFDMDYEKQHDAYLRLYATAKAEHVDMIIGSSFGGYLGYHIAKGLGRAAILFNPAMAFSRQDETFITAPVPGEIPFAFVVLGDQDDVVPPDATELFAREEGKDDNLHLVRCQWLAHRIDLATFESMIVAGLSMARAKLPDA